MIEFGEFAPDIADLNTTVCRTAENVLPAVNSYLPLPSLAATSNALTNDCKGAVVMKDNSGNTYVYAGDKTTLNNIAGVTVTDYSKAGGYTDNAEFWAFTKWGNQVIASKMGDTPQVLTLGGTTFADLAGTPPQGRTIATIRDFVVLGNTWDSTDGNVTNRVRWSGFNDEDGWTVGTNQSDQQDLQGQGGAVQYITNGEFGTVFQERSIWRMSYVGVPLVFQFDEVHPGIGTPSPRSVIQYGDNMYFLAQDGFYALLGGVNLEPIGVNKVDKYFLNDVNESYLDRISGAISPEKGLVMWSYPSTASNGEPDKLLIYNYKTGKWSHAEVNTQILLQAATTGYTLEQLDSFGTLDTLTSSLDSAVWKGGALRLGAFNTDNKLAYFSGTAMTATIETGEVGSEMGLASITEVRPVIDGTSTVTIETRDSLKDTPVSTAAKSLDSSGKANFRTHARYHRFKLITSGDFTHAQGVEPTTITKGKR